MMFTKMLSKKLVMKATVMAAPLLLVGCSSVPDSVNPVEWYRSSVEYFNEDAPKTVPQPTMVNADAQPVVQAPAEQKEIPSGFVAAQTPSRQYAQQVMRQGDVVNPLGDAQRVETVQAPAPKAAPTKPVSTTEMAAATATPSPVVNTAPADAKVNLTPPQPQQAAVSEPQVPAQMDNRSVSEIYAANIAQTRPLNVNARMGGQDTLALMNHPFETVVVSSGGVDRNGGGYGQPQQMASLNRSVQTDYRDTMTSAMMTEPAVVQNGQALSLSRFNPSMFTGSFQVATIQFGNGSAHLTDEDMRILREVTSIHRQQGGVVRIVGHASSRTRNMAPDRHQAVNMKLSVGRADMVARQLLKLGVAGERLFVGGVSDSQPLYQEVMPSGEAGNRRTEIFVDY
ncbi:putative OmpA/MotB protein [Candidatus Terasakiella magnetica]|uniref:Putative OmpA/MotB protein n=1 Tax=Candidatus Terasakiella magnetica TaxID=1867952 RepID=A0A1C3RC13_9PROT|nr:OmpA family protein [Candidatus Terasakiella magnetica]SCA54788.1 putative OmpA/MotB protein [Candidatus Terasakiella magnetica]